MVRPLPAHENQPGQAGLCHDGVARTLNFTDVGASACANLPGITITAATALYIEDCVIEHWHQGILDQRTSGLTRLVVKNTIVRDNTSAGIVAAASPTNSVVLENVQSVGNAYGIGSGAATMSSSAAR